MVTDTMLEKPLQAETWVPEDGRLSAAVAALAEAGLAATPYGFSTLDSVGAIEIESANGVAFVAASPHTDREFSRWFVMMTVKAPEGTQLHTSKKASTKNPEQLKSDLTVPLTVGEMIVFDAHRLHWVHRPEALMEVESESSGPYWSRYIATEFREEMCLMLGTESCRRPDRSQAEAMLVDYLAEKTPKIWSTVTMSVTEPATPRRGFKR